MNRRFVKRRFYLMILRKKNVGVKIAYLNIRWFMATLLDRMDRTSMYNGLEARVPLADHRIVEYVFNIPWHIKCPNGVVKGLLRHVGKGMLPEEILWRRKSPYPKTYDPAYEKLLGNRLKEVLSDPAAPVRTLLDEKKSPRLPHAVRLIMESLGTDS